ncbi:amidohydrolase family protein [Shewanella corallii]|uniref:Amidohydrolase family protein n=1 Tax=Shewanella corallii TaxID=560080 RepID=A0ABT0N6L0_9GAMM|nr:amidohydrolase family protein [Shewanella corallii]MCL2913477.1 amidohydrolase family protein [Shewanella corallii]
MDISSLILRGATVFDGCSPLPLADVDILLKDGLIHTVSSPGQRLLSEGSTEIELNGQFVMPGLIDAHFHCNSFTLDIPVLEQTHESYATLKASELLSDTLLRGFTTVRDAAGANHGLVRGVEEGVISSPRILASGKAISQTGGHGDFRPADQIQLCGCASHGSMTVIADGEDQVRLAVREQLRAGASQIKLFVSGGVLSPTDPIWMPQFTDAEILAAVQEAQTRRTYVMAHAHTADASARCARLGVRSIEHGTLIDAESAAFIADKGSFVVPTLVIIEQLYKQINQLPPDMANKLDQVRDRAFDAVEHCVKAGVSLGFGTDLFGDFHGCENEEFLLRAKVQSNFEVLRSATSVNAELINQPLLGKIQTGCIADLLVIDGNPLEDIRVMSTPEESFTTIIKAGQPVKTNF